MMIKTMMKVMSEIQARMLQLIMMLIMAATKNNREWWAAFSHNVDHYDSATAEDDG